MDIMAFIDDEPEGISFIQKDARLAGATLASSHTQSHDKKMWIWVKL